jgi:rhodanese-related sulfurtransferase
MLKRRPLACPLSWLSGLLGRLNRPQQHTHQTTQAAFSDISCDELDSWRQKGAKLIDVREPWEYARGHIPGAKNVPLGELAERSAALKGPIVFVCASGNRSARAAKRLAEQGRTDVANLVGGTAAWRQRGLPLE